MRLPRLLPIGLMAVSLTAFSLGAPSPSGGSATVPPLQTPIQAENAVPQAVESDVSVRFLQVGLSGSIQADLLTADLTGNGEVEVLLGTSRGVYILSSGTLLRYIPTSSSVMDMVLVDDVTGDGQPDLAVAVGDTYFPNIRGTTPPPPERSGSSCPSRKSSLTT
ncbi:MAG: VCBS repeat-containing protein [Chloroflexota bacterium]